MEDNWSWTAARLFDYRLAIDSQWIEWEQTTAIPQTGCGASVAITRRHSSGRLTVMTLCVILCDIGVILCDIV